jgi:hypothetical protein
MKQQNTEEGGTPVTKGSKHSTTTIGRGVLLTLVVTLLALTAVTTVLSFTVFHLREDKSQMALTLPFIDVNETLNEFWSTVADEEPDEADQEPGGGDRELTYCPNKVSAGWSYKSYGEAIYKCGYNAVWLYGCTSKCGFRVLSLTYNSRRRQYAATCLCYYK